ncbi:MAG: hypothetical protein DME87_06600 [Verrucomicrobia bacterium]|nr:MAG: hypothetical protein DME87_06600 [Verrucomicrobiota bacterium]
MNEMELLDATTVARLPDDRFDEMERRNNSRSYRCGLHMRAMLRRPKTVRFHWQGILRELSGVEVRLFSPACSMQSAGLITRETAHSEFRKEPDYFTRVNNYN